MLGSLLKGVVSTVLLPVSVTIDAVTMGATCMTNDEHEILTVKNVKNIAKHVEDALR